MKKGWSLVYAISAVIIIAIGVFIGINFFSKRLDEDRKTEMISSAQDIAKQYQEKKINNMDKFTVEDPNKRIEFSKEKDNFVFKVIIINQEDTDVVVQFPATVIDGYLKIGIEYPSFDERLISPGAFVIFEVMLLVLGISLIFESIIAWKYP